jgi:hypothetical protein
MRLLPPTNRIDQRTSDTSARPSRPRSTAEAPSPKRPTLRALNAKARNVHLARRRGPGPRPFAVSPRCVARSFCTPFLAAADLASTTIRSRNFR